VAVLFGMGLVINAGGSGQGGLLKEGTKMHELAIDMHHNALSKIMSSSFVHVFPSLGFYRGRRSALRTSLRSA
jgi:hypothetical protein